MYNVQMYILFSCELSERFQNTYSVETCEHMSASIYLLKVIETPDQWVKSDQS